MITGNLINLTKGRTVVSNNSVKCNRGFTLVELMITLVLAGIVIAAVYSAYTIQRKTYAAQEQVVEMQQNIRAAIDLMSLDLRMAGYDPSGLGSANAGITAASANSITFTADFNEDGDVSDAGENIAYDLAVTTLRRNNQPLTENIEQIEFCYVLDDDNGWADNDNDCILAPTAAQSDSIVALYLSILAVAAQRDAKFISTATINPASDDNPAYVTDWTGTSQTDGFRRRFFSSKIQLRNLGM